jgi:hypothetical protein
MTSFDFQVHCEELTTEPTVADWAEFNEWCEKVENMTIQVVLVQGFEFVVWEGNREEFAEAFPNGVTESGYIVREV